MNLREAVSLIPEDFIFRAIDGKMLQIRLDAAPHFEKTALKGFAE